MTRRYRRTDSINRSRHHWREERLSAAAVRKCQEQHQQDNGIQAESVSRPKPSHPTFEFRMALKRKAITEPDFPFPAFDADSMSDEQLCVYLFDLGGKVASDAYVAWNVAVRERVNREWQEQEAAKKSESVAA